MFCFHQGGMKAVIWTDVFQAVIMYAGLMMVVVKVGTLRTQTSLPIQKPELER